MARRIIVNGEDLDLYHDNKIAFNLRVNSIADLSNRNSSNSNSILIPRTGKNQRLLGMTGTMGNNSNVPYSSLRCDYIIQGTYIVVNGYLQIINTLANDYRIAIYDGIIDFAGLLANKVIADLDFTPENHILTFAEFEASLANTSGYIYGVFDSTKGNGLNPTDIDALGASVYAHTIWDRIFTEAGLTYVGDFFDTNTDWLSLVLPPTRGITLVESAATPTDIGTSVTDTLVDNTDYGTFIVKTWEHEFTVDGYDANVDLDAGGLGLEVLYTGTMNFAATITYSQTNTRVRWQLRKNGLVITTRDLPYVVTDSPQTVEITTEVTTGDIITITLSVDNPTPTGSPPAGYFTHVFSTSTSLQIDTVSGGTVVNVQDYMSTELTQKDFVKDILQRYGLIMLRERENTSQYRFITMEDLLEDRTNNVDWTTKLTEVVNEEYQSGYAQNNLADYTYQSEVVPYLTGNLEINNSNSAYEKTIITAPYQIPEQSVLKVASTNVYKIPIWVYDEEELDYDNVETAPRLMRLNFTSTDVNFRLFGSANTLVSVDVPLLSLVNMSYQYFFDNYYANINDLLHFYKEIDVDLDLDIVDFKQIDFGRLVYFRQTGRYYYLDTVKIQENGAQAKLIEIRNFNS